ncbi:MAG: DNA replication/repair protein RecF [Novosphingobium sp.]
MLDRLLLENFRNHAATTLAGAERFHLLVGENGAGKTNVLEAISLLAPGRGLRRAATAEMIRSGAPGFAVGARLADGGAGPVQLGTRSVPGQPARRTAQVNGAESAANRLGEWLGVTWLTPAMDRLFIDSAGARRRFLDRLVLARDPAHARLAARYEAALRERNRLLGDEREPDPAWLDGLEAQLAETGAAVAFARAALVERLDAALRALPDGPFARPALAYAAALRPGSEALAAALRGNRRRDRAAGRTLDGPHRDDLVVTLAAKDRPAAACSTGEQKAMLIAVVLAHAELAAPALPRLLLLDEVAAHLDAVRRAALFERLRAGSAQVWLSGTETAPFAGLAADAAVWRISEGAATREG